MPLFVLGPKNEALKPTLNSSKTSLVVRIGAENSVRTEAVITV